MTKNARQAWDNEQIARAVGFTTSRFHGRGRFDTRRFGDLGAARADAAGDPRAIVYAVTPEGFTIHIENGDAIATEQTMTTTTYTTKSNAIRAARAALKEKHREPMSGVHFRLEPAGDEWGWVEIDIATGEVAREQLDAALVAHRPDGPMLISLPPAPGTAPKESREAKRLRLIAEADARNAAKEQAKAEKAAAKAAAPKAPKMAAAPKAGSKKAEALAAAQRGEMPTAPDFSADTHKRFRPVLAKLVAAVEAGDLKALKADATQPVSSSRVALCRYRDLAITALEARKKLAKAA